MADTSSFLTIERSLATVLFQLWKREQGDPALRDIQKALADDDFMFALRTAESITFTGTVNSQLPTIETMTLSAVMFGQSLFTEGVIADTLIAKGAPIPIQVPIAARGLAEMLNQAGVRVRRDTEKAIEATRGKVSTVSLAPKFKADGEEEAAAAAVGVALMAGAKKEIDWASNLTTSRLVTFGALTQAESQGVQKFQISEVMDRATCPVCQGMHGKEFFLSPSLEQVERSLLSAPGQLRAANPFPIQTQAHIMAMSTMSPIQLQEQGWSVPPYHPRCRGMSVPLGTVPASEVTGFPVFSGVTPNATNLPGI